MNILYNLTKNKLNQDYINKLTQLLYDCKSVKNYSLKRMNLDKAIYKYNKNNELYITLPNFNFKNKPITYNNSINNKNISIHNFTENGSNFLTNDTNYNISYNNSNIPKKEKNNKNKLTLDDIYGQREREKLDKTLKKILLNEDLEISKNTQKLIFNDLRMKYKFEGSDNKKKYFSHSKIFPKRIKTDTETIKLNKKCHLIFPQITNNNKYLDYLNILKNKTDELNSIKQKRYKSYFSPLFFLGKNNENFMNNIKYTSLRKLSDEKNKKYENISKENKKYLKIMGNNINTLNSINNENKDIIGSSSL